MPTSPTTIDDIIGRMTTVIEGLTPTSHSSDRFRVHREEVEDFIELCEQQPAGVLRRVQIIETGDDEPPETSSGSEEERTVTIRVIVAYPKTGRYGSLQGRDRRKVLREDQRLIEQAVGMHGKANFTPPYPDATWLKEGSATERQSGEACDFLIVTQRMIFVLDVS